MTVRPIVTYGDPVLHQRAAEVTTIDDEVRTLVADMLETMKVSNGVGLAALGERLASPAGAASDPSSIPSHKESRP